MKHFACNLIYNDGGEGAYVGFEGRCSAENIIYNIKHGSGRWCSQPACSCRRFYNRGFKGKVDEFPCCESQLFENWEWDPGSEYKTGEPFRISQSGRGKIAILTTRFPNSTESDRKIIGFLKIKSLTENGHKVVALKRESLRLPLDEAKELNFWNFHRNKKNLKPEWKQGRFRYLEDDQVAAILHDLKDIVQNETTQSIITGILRSDFEKYSKTRPKVEGCIREDVGKKVFFKRKYGKGGESKEHKKLKEYISQHPDEIGLTRNKVRAFVEHQYISGDMVDILFKSLHGNKNTVVEIELDNVLPGIHQAIKYRVLRCSELGLSLTDRNVRAVIVAWSFSLEEKALCRKYAIDFFEVKLN